MLPQLYNTKKTKNVIRVFKGINRTVNAGFSSVSSNSSNMYVEFENVKNMSSDDYPILSSRNSRSYSACINTNISESKDRIISNIIATKAGLRWIERDGNLYTNGGLTNLYGAIDTTSKKSLYTMGDKIIVMPDKIMLDGGNIKKIEESFTATSAGAYCDNVDYIPRIHKFAVNTSINSKKTNRFICSSSIDFSNLKMQHNSQPYAGVFSQIEIGDFVENKSTIPSSLFQATEIVDLVQRQSEYPDYNSSDYPNGKLIIFTQIYNTYLKINFAGIGENFNIDDYVTISEITDSDSEYTGQFKDYVETLNSSFKIYDKGNDFIVIKAETNYSIPYTGKICVERKMPEMDFVVENCNRLWGCSSSNNEIYCCRLGDVFNWYAYGDGISTDSYALTVGTEGDFTGAAAIGNNVIFFKENYIHRIIGTKPSNFSLTTYNQTGIEKGSSKSLVQFGSSFFYKSKFGISFYSIGSTVKEISTNLGNEIYKNAVAGRHKDKLYISMQNQSGEYSLYVYDTVNGLWLKEDNIQFDSTFTYNDILYFVDSKGNIGCIQKENNLFYDFKKLSYSDRIGEIFTDSSGKEYLCGDANSDGIINYNDLTVMQDYIKLDNRDYVPSMDINDDKYVDITDVTNLQKYLSAREILCEDSIDYEAVTANLYDYIDNNKYISKLQIRLEADGVFEIFIMQNNDDKWVRKYICDKSQKQSILVPIIPQRFDTLKLKIKGSGKIRVYDITLTIEGGSEHNGIIRN